MQLCTSSVPSSGLVPALLIKEIRLRQNLTVTEQQQAIGKTAESSACCTFAAKHAHQNPAYRLCLALQLKLQAGMLAQE